MIYELVDGRMLLKLHCIFPQPDHARCMLNVFGDHHVPLYFYDRHITLFGKFPGSHNTEAVAKGLVVEGVTITVFKAIFKSNEYMLQLDLGIAGGIYVH